MMGDILGSIIGPLTEGMASAAQYQASKHERNIAWKRAQQWELMAPSLRVAGLEAAGLNPVLAATGGINASGSMPNVPQASPGQLPRFPSDSVSRVISNVRQKKAMDTELAILREQLEINRQHAFQEQERTRQEAVNTEVVRLYGVPQAAGELAVTQQQLLNLVAEAGFTSARTAESEQAKLRTYADRLLIQMGIPGARAMEALYEEYPLLRQLREFSGGSLGGAALGAAGAAGVGAAHLMKKDKAVGVGPRFPERNRPPDASGKGRRWK